MIDRILKTGLYRWVIAAVVFVWTLSVPVPGWSADEGGEPDASPETAEAPQDQPADIDYKALDLFVEVLTHLREEYVEPISDEELINSAVRGMLRELDPHSVYMTSHVFKEMEVMTRGSFAGLGIEVSMSQDGFVEVIAPIDDTPASKAGILPRDQIVSICPEKPPESWNADCRMTNKMTLEEAIQLMRGKKGTPITIEIMREGFAKPKSFTLIRDIIQTISVSGRMLEPGYAYVRISSFQGNTAFELRKKLEELKKESGKFDGLVLDLRDNPGGLLDQAVDVADLWLDDGLIVYTRGRLPRDNQEARATNRSSEENYPMIVLINEGSASASEIVAGALQDHHRALILGVRSFGKGSVQTIFNLSGDAGMKITTALYYTPSGRSIQEVGIEPDIVVTPAHVAAVSPDAVRHAREQDLEGHFTHAKATGKDEKSQEEPKQEEAKPVDVQLVRALEVLKSWHYFEPFYAKPESAAPTATKSE